MSSDTSNENERFGMSYNEMRSLTQTIHVIAQVITLFAVGCRLLPRNFKGLEKGFCTGLFLQSFILPAVGCLIAIAFELETSDALATIATAAAPVASYVSVLTHWAGGNVALSVLMTAMSTTLAIGLLPMWFYFYSNVWVNSVFITASPQDIAMYLSIIILPMGCGMFVRAFLPKAAKYLAKYLSFAFLVETLLVASITAIIHPSQFDAEWKLFAAAFALPVTAYLLGFLSAFILRLSYEKCVAVSMAIGASNCNLIISTARRLIERPQNILKLPEMYSFFAPIQGLAWAVFYNRAESINDRYPNLFGSKEYDEM